MVREAAGALGCGIEVVRAGMRDTVQDRGRFGYQALGFSPAGAMDRRSAAVANLLVGNPAGAAVLECAFSGPVLRFDRPAVVCVAGATTDARLDGAPLEPYAAHAVAAGQTLDVGRASWGAYAYLAVAGGIDVPAAMGSRSTSCAYGLGGFEGRALRAGDVLPLAADAPAALPGIAARRLASRDAYFRRDADPARPTWVRAVRRRRRGAPGRGVAPVVLPRPVPGHAALRPHGAAPRALRGGGPARGSRPGERGGRPGMRAGPRVRRAHRGVGRPPRRPAAAPRRASWQGVDLPRLAQLRPGQTVRFERVGVEEAQRLAREEARFLEGLRAGVERAAGPGSARLGREPRPCDGRACGSRPTTSDTRRPARCGLFAGGRALRPTACGTGPTMGVRAQAAREAKAVRQEAGGAHVHGVSDGRHRLGQVDGRRAHAREGRPRASTSTRWRARCCASRR